MIALSDIARELEAHASSCKAPVCRRCGRWRCDTCGRVCEGTACEICERDARWAAAARSLRIPPRFEWAALGDVGTLTVRVKRRAAIGEVVRALAHEARAVVLRGPTGTGKTSLGVAALRARFSRDFDARPSARHLFASACDLACARAAHPLGQGEPAAFRAAVRATVLLVDDLGAEPTRFADEIARVIAARHDAQRVTWATTWMNDEQIGARYGGGCERRLLESATVIACGEESGR